VSATDTAANASARAEAREGDADTGLVLTTRAVADLWCLRAAALSPGDAGAVARAKLLNLCEMVGSVCAPHRVMGSGEAYGWDSAVREARRAEEAERRAEEAERRAESARGFVDLMLTVDPELIDREFIVASLEHMRATFKPGAK